MGAGSDLRRIVSRRLAPLVADLEEHVFRYGYFRTLTGTLASLGTVGLLGQVLGLTWLRITFATAAAGLFVLVSALSFAGTQRLRGKLKHIEELLHTYADHMHSTSPLSVREWRQEVTVEENGDAHCRRDLVLDAAANGTLRYVSVNLVYYGTTRLTNRDRRKVRCHAYHAGEDDVDQRTRADGTSVWTFTADGKPKLDIYIHLGTVVQAGDLITVEWDWPGYSADLMNGTAPESFDVLFNKEIGKFEHRVVFRNVRSPAAFKVRNQNAQNLRRHRVGQDIVVEFSAEAPERETRMGFIADYSQS
ncbi:hypothetical protein [Amycolatopsis sp. DG1A-15b]|uniref:hypothetical protein n=1 Tax=Amycolatopsis sp. DG1A-15b TaxID=3052846 RepID=UPI00255BE59E|nr:hypothetical protein [Amycolatopsis sp. DG1A-15b]WIX87635.1 hypothetical protein QRY02_41925 [Amycolatopsis sp. DG1A-15b]